MRSSLYLNLDFGIQGEEGQWEAELVSLSSHFSTTEQSEPLPPFPLLTARCYSNSQSQNSTLHPALNNTQKSSFHILTRLDEISEGEQIKPTYVI